MLDEIFDLISEDRASIEEVLAKYTGLDATETAQLRADLKGTRLLIGAEECLRLARFTYPSPDTLERAPMPGVEDHPEAAKAKARALLYTAEGRRLFDALVAEGFAATAPKAALRRGVILMALLCGNFREKVRMVG